MIFNFFVVVVSGGIGVVMVEDYGDGWGGDG